LIWQHQIRQVVFTGTDTDPQLYQHEARLLVHLRKRLSSKTQFSLHTNGRLALRKIEIFNQYDRVTLSLPSFQPATYQQMMGVPGPPDLSDILRKARIPVKISCLVTTGNANEIPQFLAHCRTLGVQRVVLRKRFGEHKPWEQITSFDRLPFIPQDEYRSNPVNNFQGMEVTLWDFDQCTSKSINLFASGLISSTYLLTEAQTTPNAPLWHG